MCIIVDWNVHLHLSEEASSKSETSKNTLSLCYVLKSKGSTFINVLWNLEIISILLVCADGIVKALFKYYLAYFKFGRMGAEI